MKSGKIVIRGKVIRVNEARSLYYRIVVELYTKIEQTHEQLRCYQRLQFEQTCGRRAGARE